ncbi:hypothetical protein TNCV_4156681 [Trichonephila clavipes]|nr:hypothetical protein TNCV_4156681 [Trichonephila clavipes]
MGEAVDPGMNVEDLKQKLMRCKAYLEDEEFVKDFLNTTVEERKEEERRLEREHELEFARKEAEERRLERK